MALGGVKRSNIINFNNKINFKGFYTKLFLFLQIKEMKHIEWEFALMPR